MANFEPPNRFAIYPDNEASRISIRIARANKKNINAELKPSKSVRISKINTETAIMNVPGNPMGVTATPAINTIHKRIPNMMFKSEP